MSDLNPGASVQEYASKILAENAKWAARLNQTFPPYFPDPKEKQAPKILWLGCSDSRVQESDATMALPGNIFVHRNIANQFHLHDDNALSVLAYAVRALGVQHVVIVGHEHCGGVITAMHGASHPLEDGAHAKRHHTLQDSLYHAIEEVFNLHLHDETKESDEAASTRESPNDALTRWITPLSDRLRGIDLPEDRERALQIAVEENVKMQVENLAGLEAFVKKWAKRRPVWVHGWVYDFATGFLRDLHITKVLGGEA